MIGAPTGAAAQGRSLVEEMQERLLQMQQQMMQDLQGLEQSGDSSGIYFHFDTTFNGDNGQGSAHFFRFTPPGDSLSSDPSGLEEFFRGMFDIGDPTEAAGAQPFPKDDGNMPHPDDELLPEDRLRLQEQQPAASPAKPAKPPAKKKPVVESIRI